MARRSKAQIALDNRIAAACQNACNGLSINMMKLHQITTAATAAANSGGDVEGAARAKAVELHNQDNPNDQR
jgi:hypothetical protein